ncbi:hypothetical protein SFRURICE_011714 [Spodoptera frugiperda]|nr:hypothetical protein SFRURICE_011714 [Spodoptera frugiperda]
MSNNYKPKEVEIKTESIDNNIADSDALDKALDKMLANKKLIVKFKHKNPKNDEIKVINAVDVMHSNDSMTPINLYESVNDSPDRIPKETAGINTVDKRGMKMKQIDLSSGNDYEDGITESKDIPELLMEILKKKVRKEPVLRNEFVLKNKNVHPHRFVIENPQSHEETVCKKVSHGRKSKKVPINAELTDYEDNNYEKKLNEYYKSQLQERRVVNQVVPSMSVEDSLSTENYSFKKKGEAKTKEPRTFKTKDRKKHKRNKRAHKQKKKKDIEKQITRTKRSKTKNILRNRDNNLQSLNTHKPDVLDTIEIKIANPIPGRKRPKKEKHHAVKYNDPYGRMTNYEEYESTTRKPKVKKVHSSSNIASSKVKKHKDEVKSETTTVHSKNKDYHESSGIAKSISWDSSEDIDPEDLTRTNHEKKDLNSYEELLRENEIKKHPQLPFYISTPKATTLKKKYTNVKKDLTTNSKVYHKILMVENTTTKLDISPLRHKEELQKHYKIDMNATLQQLASSTMLDMLTEKIAAQMLEKLQKRLEQHGLRALGLTEQENDSVEHIEILFSNDGNMQIVSNRKDDLNPNKTMNVSTGNVSYTIPLEELDLSYLQKYMERSNDRPLKLWSNTQLNGDSEYCQVKIVSKEVMGKPERSYEVKIMSKETMGNPHKS